MGIPELPRIGQLRNDFIWEWLINVREKRNLRLHLFAIPAIILVVVYLYYPIFDTLYTSLFDIRAFNFEQRTFVGLQNYQKLIADPTFIHSLRNTVLMTSGTIFIQLPIAFLLADGLANHVRKNHPRLETLLLVALFLPIALPTPVYAKTWKLFFSPGYSGVSTWFEWIVTRLGIEESLKQLLGMKTIYLLGELKVAFWVLLAVQTWARIGFNLLIYRSAILGIPVELYESAELDGAGPWSKLFRITIPLTLPVVSVTIVLAILGVFQLFDLIWMTTLGGPLNSTHLLATYMYSRTFEDLRPGYGAAIAMFILVIAVGLSLIQRWVFRDTEQEVLG